LLRSRTGAPSVIIASTLRLLLVNGLVWTGLGLVLALTRQLPLAGLSYQALTLAILASLFAATISVVRQLLNGLGDLRGVNLNLLVQSLSLPVALLPALVLTVPTAAAALGAYVASLALTATAAAWRLAPWSGKSATAKADLIRPLVMYGLKSQVTTLIMILAYRSDLFLVNHFLGVAAAGVYSVALTLSEILRGVAETGQMIVVAHAAKADLAARAHAIARQALVVTALGALAMAAASKILVPVVFGEAYRDAAGAFGFLAPGVVGLALSYALSPLLFLEGKILVNGAAALAGLATLWFVGILGPGEPTLTKFAAASSLAYWVLAGVQIGVLRLRGQVRLLDLAPTWRDLSSLGTRVRSLNLTR
jgi:O-antigen/teichoic acid export membrane protein